MTKTYTSLRAKPYIESDDFRNANGFARRLSHVRSPWPSLHIGKLLDDKTIANYQKKGFYASSVVELRRLQQKEQAEKNRPRGKKLRKDTAIKFTREQIEKMFE